jgi:protein phosphatase 2C family protein 2/3
MISYKAPPSTCENFVIDRTMIIANAGDCRAVLGRQSRAIEMSRDPKPNCTSERLRIEKLGAVEWYMTDT